VPRHFEAVQASQTCSKIALKGNWWLGCSGFGICSGIDRRIGRLPELRRAVEFARELPGMIARRAQELRHGLRHGLDRGPRLGL